VQVRPVDGQVRTQVGDDLPERGQDPVQTIRQRTAVRAQLAREPVRGVDTGSGTERVPQGGMLTNEPHGARPRQEGADALDEREPHHGPDGVAPASGPAGHLKVGDQPR
jgi:hypothetical protein